jgi:hypothetical protein
VFCTDFLEQSSAVYSASSLAAAALAALELLADGEGVDEAEAEALVLADGVESAFSASLAARP